jgi:hypothetical protein
MFKPLRLSMLFGAVALVSACGLSDSDRALITSASQNAAEARDAANAAKQSADRATAAAQQATEQARANARAVVGVGSSKPNR